MAVVDIVRTFRAVQYDGTNGAEVVSNIGTLPDGGASIQNPCYPEIASETDGVLTVSWPGAFGYGYQQVVNSGDWIILPTELNPNFEVTTAVAPLSTLTNP